MRQKLLEKARAATPAERRDMINQTPEAFRDEMKKSSLSTGVIFDVHTPEGSRLVAVRKG